MVGVMLPSHIAGNLAQRLPLLFFDCLDLIPSMGVNVPRDTIPHDALQDCPGMVPERKLRCARREKSPLRP